MKSKLTFKQEGFPLSELGLENAVIKLSDGSIVSLEGFIAWPDKTLVESIEQSLPEGATLFINAEAAKDGR